MNREDELKQEHLRSELRGQFDLVSDKIDYHLYTLEMLKKSLEEAYCGCESMLDQEMLCLGCALIERIKLVVEHLKGD